jgi:hypothetical protein
VQDIPVALLAAVMAGIDLGELRPQQAGRCPIRVGPMAATVDWAPISIDKWSMIRQIGY